MGFASKTEKPVTDQITSWSFSRWNTYEACPRKLKFTAIDKLKEPSSPILERGTALHELCEHYLRGMKRTIPKELEKIADVLKDYKKRGAIPEAEFAYDRQWNPVSWFDKSAWVRIKADVVIPPIIDADVPTVEVHDFKTGGEKKLASGDFEEYYTQLELYAMAGLLTYPLAQVVKTSLVFIDHGRVIEHREEFKRGDEKKIMKKWETRTKKMLADKVFKEKPGNACRWCFFRKANADKGGGQCRF